MRRAPFGSLSSGRQQRGVVLMIALIMLVSMTLAGLALYRQMGTGLIIARNLTFKRAAVVAADLGIETARTWIAPPALGCDDACKATKAAELLSAQQVSGKFFYYPAWCYSPTVQSASGVPINCGVTLTTVDFDPRTYDWTHAAIATTDDGSGNEIRYVIHRLCALPGGMNIVDTPNQRCASIGRPPAGLQQGTANYGNTGIALINMPYYRITARVRDRLNTLVYTQAIIY